MKRNQIKKALSLWCAIVISTAAHAIGGDGCYFTQTFEDSLQVPQSKIAEDQVIMVDGQGEWIYNSAFQASNTSYIPDGSAYDLRLPKGGSYVITPLLDCGVDRVTFDIGRASVKVYVSTNGGQTWEETTQNIVGKKVTVSVVADGVNRVKVANDASKDADIDNLAVYAQTYESPVELTTEDATDVTADGATLHGSIVKNDGQEITQTGFVWSNINKSPTLDDNVALCEGTGMELTVMVKELRQGATHYFRAFARYADTWSYGTVKSFKTLTSDEGQTVDSLGRYFVQDFEDAATFPQEKGAQDAEYYVAGQGTWIYTNAFVSTNTSYNPEGSTMNLRLPKNGSYVITPVLNSGVKRVTFYAGRKGDKLTASTSKDGGNTWTDTAITLDGNNASFEVTDLEVNRIRIANNSSGDADIDNLVVYAEAFGTPATVVTGTAMNITKNTAEVSGMIADRGDQPIQEAGIIWALQANPTLADNVVEDEDPNEDEISVLLTGLKAEQTIYFRAYALSNAGYAYGAVGSFTTAEATPAVVATSDVTKSGKKFRLGGIVTDDGGLELTEVGVFYSKEALDDPVNSENVTRLAMSRPSYKFSATVALDEATTYYIRAYAVTAKGMALGAEKSFTTEDVPEQPDIVKGDIIWCSPDGDDSTADGSEEHPFYDLQKAVDLAQPGDRIWMKAGTYVYDKRININDRNGEPDSPIELFGKDGRAVLDFSGMPYHAHSNNPYQGVRLTSSYWHFYMIDITNASDNGLLIERNKPTGGSASDIAARTQDAHDNLIEQCNFYRNGDTGLQMKNLAANNRVINCDSYLNCDEGEGDADGFAPKLSVGDNNYFYGCRAWANSDDGWDVFYKKEGGFGDNMTIIIENCISYKNGFLDLQTIAPSGNGNGFKCGSNQGAMNVYMNRCLAIHNKAKGFDQNHNAGDIILNNCTGMTLKSISDKSYSYRIYESIADGHEVRLTNCIAINDNDATDKRDKTTGEPKPGEHGKYGEYGRFEVDETLEGMTITTCEFQKAAPTEFVNVTDDEQLTAERDDDGELPEIAFAHLTEGSFLIDAGTKIEPTTYRGIDINGIEYSGEAPDLGAYEYDGESFNGIRVVNQQSIGDNNMRLIQTRNGMVIVSLGDSNVNNVYNATLTAADGRILGRHTFQGPTTAMRLPQTASGIVVIKVDGQNGWHGAVKALLK